MPETAFCGGLPLWHPSGRRQLGHRSQHAMPAAVIAPSEKAAIQENQRCQMKVQTALLKEEIATIMDAERAAVEYMMVAAAEAELDRLDCRKVSGGCETLAGTDTILVVC